MNQHKKLHTGLVASLLFMSYAPNASSQEYKLTLELPDGTVVEAPMESYQIGLERQVPQMTLVIPADVGARTGSLVSIAEDIPIPPYSDIIRFPRMTIEYESDAGYLRIDLKNTFITSFSTSGSAGEIPVDNIVMSYAGVEVTDATGTKVFDCTSGTCRGTP